MTMVLIIDDNQQLSWWISAQLQRLFPVSVHVAPSVREARKALQQHPIDLVLLDILLPDGFGTELVPDLRSLTPVPQVIIMSMLEVPRLAQSASLFVRSLADAARSLRPAAYLVKPFNDSQLVHIIRSLRFKGTDDNGGSG